jgi:hypothetical protein
MKGFVAVVAVVVAAVFVPSTLAGNNHRTLGPAGYDTPGQSALVLAGTAGVELGAGDHVVICHAIGGARGDRFIQIAPSSSGVLHGHDGHEGDRDIIPPYTYVDHKGKKDTSLAAGNNWSGANIELYRGGCSEPRRPDDSPEPPKDECPNIAGHQAGVPSGLVKDSSGNCVQPHQGQPQDVCPNIEGFQSAVPAGLVKDASGKCVCPPVTVTVGTVPQTVPQAVQFVSALPAASVIERTAQATPKAKTKAKKKAKVKKAKKIKKKAKIKAKRAKKAQRARVPRVLPFTPHSR